MNRRYQRLWVTHEEIKFLFADHERIGIVDAAGDPPDRYVIEYRVRGLTETKEGIVEREVHRVQITLGPNYPNEAPYCVMLTPVFHPNIDGFKICTEDVTPAGRRLDQVIVFIGRLITFQAYNLASTRNGEARVWAEQHMDHFPLESVELLPRALLEGRPLPVFSARDIPAPKPAPSAEQVEDTRPPCANCGRPVTGSCSSGHHVCADCSLVCPNCQRLLCALCELHTCAECSCQVCAECWIACSNCGHELCATHARFCAACKAPRCRTCLAVCGNCGGLYCSTHLDDAGRCPSCGRSSPRLEEPQSVDEVAPAAPVVVPSNAGVRRITPRMVISAEEALAVPETALLAPESHIELVPPESPPRSGKAIASLIFGLLGVPVLGILVGWFAVLFGVLALRDIRRAGRLWGRKLAISGLCLGICDIVLWLVLAAAFGPSVFAPRFGPLPEAQAPQPVKHKISLTPVRI